MAITGSFKSSAEVYGLRESSRGPGRANWGTGVQPGHMGTEGAPAGQELLHAPVMDTVPSEIEDPWTVTDPPTGPAADFEPSGHEGIGTVPAYIPARRADVLNAAARSIDRGANVHRQGIASAVARDSTESIYNAVVPSLPVGGDRGDTAISGNALRALTGRNSLAPNNPGSPEVNFSGDYLRRGGELVRYTDRNLGTHGWLNHTKRPLHSNEADGAKNSGPSQGRYGSPFSNFADLASGPGQSLLRREPRPWDEGDIQDGGSAGYADDAYQYQTWSA